MASYKFLKKFSLNQVWYYYPYQGGLIPPMARKSILLTRISDSPAEELTSKPHCVLRFLTPSTYPSYESLLRAPSRLILVHQPGMLGR